ncbi:MAG TPA: YARHG domain-containing protein [Kofleriaceae bacterium]|nr:YARHG domain-containing protein [Kofleriaceae bacterium]
MTRSCVIVLAGFTALAACKGGGDRQPAAGGAGLAAAPTAGSSARPAAGSGSATTAAGPVAAGPGSAAPAAVPVGPKVKAARCGEPCLLLTDTPLAKLIEIYKAECGGMETKDLGYEDCKSLDYARNCIYAAHGLVFKKKKWQVFQAKPWYEPRPEFKSEISPLELANVSELNKRGKACKKGVNISGADFERLKQWVAAANAGKLPPAKVIFVENEPRTAADFAAWLKAQLDAGQASRKLSVDRGAIGSYEKWDEVPAELVAALNAPAGAKLRSILIDINDPDVSGTEDNPITEGINLRFIYDDQDQLLAIAGAHYLYD